MKLAILIGLIHFSLTVSSQVKIHAHNDYEKPFPLVNALNNMAYIIEADVYPGKPGLLVAHSRREIDSTKTLSGLYIHPIIQLFKSNDGYISNDTSYRLTLMIDIKEKGTDVIQQLMQLIKPYQKYFDRNINPAAVRIVLSGDRGEMGKWKDYPPYIFFDGRPYDSYDSITSTRVPIISDSYFRYVSREEPLKMDSLKIVADKVHTQGKLVRFWGGPDNPEIWRAMKEAGVDIINTDKVEECRKFFEGEFRSVGTPTGAPFTLHP